MVEIRDCLLRMSLGEVRGSWRRERQKWTRPVVVYNLETKELVDLGA